MVFLILPVRGRGVDRSCMSTIVCTAAFDNRVLGFMVMGNLFED